MSNRRIDQFADSVAAGDGVTNGMLFTRQLLRELGYRSDIYANNIPAALKKEIFPAKPYVPAADTLLLYHHSMGHDHGQWLLSLNCQKAMVYHNITPPEFFPAGSGLQRYAILGRQQLAEWRDAFVGAIGDSPLNRAELVEAGYQDSQVIPLLVDTRRLEGPSRPPRWVEQRPAETRYYLAIGRLVENKRQHLLIEAFYHLQRRAGDNAAQNHLVLVGGTSSEAYANGLQQHIEQLGLEKQVTLAGKCAEAELRWLYQNAWQYWCASAHEGFCMPLIEANHADLPILTTAHSNIPETLGEGGMLLGSDDPLDFAVTSALLDELPGLREQVIAAGRRNLRRYSYPHLKDQLAAWVATLP